MNSRSTTTLLVHSALLVLLAASLPCSAHALEPFSVAPAAAEDDSAYSQGVRSMDEHRWADAVSNFDRVVNAKAKKADAALYWKAYSLNRMGNGPLALESCLQLRSQYAASAWNKDCSALVIDVHGQQQRVDAPVHVEVNIPPIDLSGIPQVDMAHNVGPGGHATDADIKILALNSLLNQDPAKAIPQLRGILSSDQPMHVKKHAIFVLAQSKSPEAQSILHDAVTGKMDPQLQREAIQMMAVFQGRKANDTLAEVYRTTTDSQLKRSIIAAMFITQDAPRMVEMARNEKDLDLKRSIVSQLALMHDKAATDYMMELIK